MSFEVGDLVTWHWDGAPMFKVEVLVEPDADGEFYGEVLDVFDDIVCHGIGKRRIWYRAHDTTTDNLGYWVREADLHSIERCLKPLREVKLKRVSVRLERIPDCCKDYPNFKYRVVVTDWGLQERTGLSADLKYKCKYYAEAVHLYETFTQPN